MATSTLPTVTRTARANLKAAVLVADHAEACGLPEPTLGQARETVVLDPETFIPEDQAPRIEFTVATGADVQAWAAFLGTEVQARGSLDGRGRAYIHASTIGEFCEAWIRVSSCERVTR